jgi:hypothetical protein
MSIDLSTCWSKLSKYAVLAGAALLLVLAIVLALLDRVAAATLMAGLFVVLALFHYLPQMESFKAYGIEAKWRAKLGEADELLRKLRQSTLASAMLTYNMIGWGSRLGGIDIRTKQKLADEAEAALADLNVDSVKISELKRDYLLFVAYDLFQGFDTIVGMNISATAERMTKRINELGNNPELPDVRELGEKQRVLRQARPSLDLVRDLQKVDIRQYAQARIPTSGLDQKDESILRRLADDVADTVELIRRTGRVEEQAIQLLERLRIDNHKSFYFELFGKPYG